MTLATPAEVAAALTAAAARARSRYTGQAARDAAADAGADAVREAALAYDPARGPFARQAASYVARAQGRAVSRAIGVDAARPRRTAGPDDVPAAAAASADFLLDLAALPDPVRELVSLHVLHGYSLTDAGLLRGLRPDAARRLLRRAAGIVSGNSDPAPA